MVASWVASVLQAVLFYVWHCPRHGMTEPCTGTRPQSASLDSAQL